MRLVSLDTPNDVLWANDNSRAIARIMSERPTPATERVQLKRTKSGNLVAPRAR